MVLKIRHLGNEIRNTRVVLKCGAREDGKKSVGPIV
jgi:hypothetical protein